MCNGTSGVWSFGPSRNDKVELLLRCARTATEPFETGQVTLHCKRAHEGREYPVDGRIDSVHADSLA
jgi:hypothetical protein